MNQRFLIQIKKLTLIVFILVTTVGCDQVTKKVVQDTLRFSEPLSYFGNSIRLQYAENKGAFLSLGADLSIEVRKILFVFVVGVFLTGVLFCLIFRKQTMSTTIGFALLLGGGIGNLIDRIFHAYVIDFLNFGVSSIRTGIFNVADIAVVIGFVILFFESFRKPSSTHGVSKRNREPIAY